MKYSLVVKPSVTAEVSKVYAYREQEKSGGGVRFLEALAACYTDIKANPYRYSIRKGEYRHVMLHKLKYRVVYRIKGDHIYVVQVRHTSRKPSKKFGP
ncbi:MAG: type II toxin-antitoxin system RelE/ParE family toxin [Flavobacteriales bacterium]|nr:type II toxin-antitoxin system RelE/ParE family toxin [Flavobacteriales bacterium]